MKVEINRACSFSQMGRRDCQEDSRIPDLDEIDISQRFFAICDGVGGNCCGDLASKTVCDTIQQELSGYGLEDMPYSDNDLGSLLNDVYIAINKVSNHENRDMATTLALVIFHQGGVLLAHIGDSRIYLLRRNQDVIYRSEDHSVVNELVKSGIIQPEEATVHPQKHIITRAICPTQMEQDRVLATVAHVSDLHRGDVVFLCSDGVTECLSDKQLTSILLKPKHLSERVKELAECCANSYDNNTGIAIEIGNVLPDGIPAKGNSQIIITQVEASKPTASSLIDKIKSLMKIKNNK